MLKQNVIIQVVLEVYTTLHTLKVSKNLEIQDIG